MQSSSIGQDPTLVAKIARWWRNWWGNRAGVAELDNFDRNELKHISRDIGASTEELRALAGKWPESADLLTRRMAALQLDPLATARSQPAVSNDLKKLCSLCVSKGRCEHDLAEGAINSDWREYCPNATTLTALSAQRTVQETNGKKQ